MGILASAGSPGQIVPMVPPRFDLSHLTPEERLNLIGELWDSLDESQLEPLSAEQRAELERRAAEAEADPAGGRPWSEVRDELRKLLD